jgi:hypothetical protein
VLVYIAEAHASDEWPIGDRVCVKSQARTTADRAALASRTMETLELSGGALRCLVDPPEHGDAFCTTYGAWPIRCFVFDRVEGTLAQLAQPEQCTYDIDAPFEFVLARLAAC